VQHSDHSNWIKRYQKEIDKYIDENRSRKDFSCDVLFLGSSSINLWDNIYNDMAPLKIIRRSYGGAAIRDMIYYYDVIARNYNPKRIVLYVENDVCGSKEDLSVGEAYDLFRVFIQKIKRDYPDIPLYIMSIKPSPSREKQLKKQLMLNYLIEDFANYKKNIYYIDITENMYDSNGKLKTDIFKADRLHMNQKGYDIWTNKIKPILMNGL